MWKRGPGHKENVKPFSCAHHAFIGIRAPLAYTLAWLSIHFSLQAIAVTNISPPIPIAHKARGYLIAAFSVTIATAGALLLELLVSTQSLVLIFVIAVVATGLSQGSRPAILASLLSFGAYNFFFTQPRLTFEVALREEFASLLFLLLIALLSGAAAARIRAQFSLLHAANRHSEEMRKLAQALAEARNAAALWRTLAEELRAVLQTESCVVTREAGGALVFHGAGQGAFTPGERAAIDQALARPGAVTGTASAWIWFPVWQGERPLALAGVRRASPTSLVDSERALVADMLRQAGESHARMALAAELESARVKAEVEQLRSALLSSVSHDLKSPLAAMMGAAETLKVRDAQLRQADRLELVDAILQESGRLDAYIQNLLDMTRLGQGALKVERSCVSVADIVGSAMARLKRYFPGVKIRFHCAGSPPLLWVHAALVEQALYNILENAAKFSPPGEIIEIDVSGQEEACLVAVEDHGPGIPHELREKVFDMFFVTSGGDRKVAGSGLGLAICRAMIAAHGGSVCATDGRDGRGSRFLVTIPTAVPARQSSGEFQ